MLSLPGAPLAAQDDGVGDHADEDGEQRPRCAGKSHGQQRLREIPGGKIRAGNANKHDREEIVQKRDARLAAGAEITAEAELHAGKEAVPDVAAQILPARGGDGGIRREEADERLGDKLDEDDDRDAERAGDHRGVAQCETHAFGLARADILRAERRNG